MAAGARRGSDFFAELPRRPDNFTGSVFDKGVPTNLPFNGFGGVERSSDAQLESQPSKPGYPVPVTIAWLCCTVTGIVAIVVKSASVPACPAPTQSTRQLIVAATWNSPPGAVPDEVL